MTGTVGTIFEGFRLQRQLGEGWLGSVHVAQGLDDGQSQALKIVKPELVTQAQFMVQFRRLFTKCEHLGHPGILRPGHLLEREQHVIYTMPLAASGSVRQLLQGHVRDGHFLDQLVVIDTVRQAADAIAYAHSQNLIHGNLKPENLLLTPAKAIMGRRAYATVVSDFGVAELQAFTHGVHDRQIVSSPAYMAPEQFRGIRTDPRSDIYSLGVILYELLTNLLPFETNDATEAADKHLHVAPIPPGQIRLDIPASLEEVILTCMAKSPEYRYRTMGELEEALQASLNELLPRGPRPTVILPDLPEPLTPTIEPMVDRTPYYRIQVCDDAGRLLRVEAVREDQVTIGRAPSNTFVLEHAGVSRHHLTLDLHDAQLYVTDLGSTNGTTIQGVALAPRTETHWPDGTVLRIEPFWLRLQPPQRVVKQARIGVLVSENDIELMPGKLVNLPVQLANTGRTVDHFRLEVDGVPDTWVQNLYTEVQLNPSTTTTMNLRVLVPSTFESRAQTYPMRVIARSVENPEDIGYAPMNWTVLPFYETEAIFKPQRRSAWRRTHYHLVLRNLSNAPLTYRPTLDDEEGEVRLQTPWEQIHLPTGGTSLRNIIPVRTIVLNTYLRLREGIGKVRISGLPQEIALEPGEEFRQRLDVKLPIRWIATSKIRKLSFDPRPSAGIDRLGSLTLNHLPLVPLWALPLLALAAVGFGYWMLLPPRVIVSVDPVRPRPEQPFYLNFRAQNTTRLEIKPFNKTVFNTRQPFLVSKGIPNTTTVQVIAHGRIKTSEQNVNIEVDYPAPALRAFRVYPEDITPGQEATVQWDIGGVDTVQLEPFGTVPARGEKKIIVKEDTAFTLSAKNQGGSLNEERKVKLLPAVVDFFDVPAQADVGQTIKIRWRVLNGRSVEIDPLGTVDSRGEAAWPVRGNETFTLRVDNAGQPQTVSKTLMVYPPRIEDFTVQPQNAKIGETVKVHWKTSHASDINISPLGTVPANGEQTYRISAASTMFTISAGNGLTSEQRQVSVNGASVPPTVQSVEVKPAQIRTGQLVSLNWQTTDAVSVELSGLPQGNITLPPSGSTQITAPSASTLLTFTAKSSDGTVAIKTIQLVVKPTANAPNSASAAGTIAAALTHQAAQTKAASTPAPSIEQFGANSATLKAGKNTHLHWQVEGAAHVKLFPGGQVYAPSTSVSVQPQTTTVYTLVAGPLHKQITVTVLPASASPTKIASNSVSSVPAVAAATTPATTAANKPSAAINKTPAASTWNTQAGNRTNLPATPPPISVSLPVPQVTALTLQKNQIKQGQTTRLTWKATGTSTVTVTPPGKTMANRGTLLVSPRTTTTYTVHAGNSVLQRTLFVKAAPASKPPPAPKPTGSALKPLSPPAAVKSSTAVESATIVYFRSDDPGVLAGRAATIRWEAKGIENVKLMPENKVLPAQGTLKVRPGMTTTYTLVAGGAAETLTLKVFGTVSPAATLGKGAPSTATSVQDSSNDPSPSAASADER